MPMSDGDVVPFCACGRQITECDGSRVGCRLPSYQRGDFSPECRGTPGCPCIECAEGRRSARE